MRFINDAQKKGDDMSKTAKQAYTGVYTDFNGDQALDALMLRIKQHVKKDRIRLCEFFQDHDSLRKGNLHNSKFRGVLHA
jgi:hypothetical protein